MYIPKQDDAFGSSYFFKGLGAPSNKSYYRSYLVTRTRWKTISTPNQRCDDGNSAANTTTCITRYIEQKVGCSMGLQGTDPNLSRYPNLSFISDLKSILWILYLIQMQWDQPSETICHDLSEDTICHQWHRDIPSDRMPIKMWQVSLCCPTQDWTYGEGQQNSWSFF